MRAMMTLLEQDGKFSAGAEINYDRRLELVKMLEDFNRSYHSLAEKYDQLRSKLHHVSNSESMHSSSFRTNKKKGHFRSNDEPELDVFDFLEPVVGDPDAESDNTHFYLECLNKLADELMSTEPCKIESEVKLEIKDENDRKSTDFCVKEDNNTKMNDYDSIQATAADSSEGSHEWQNTWSEFNFQVTKLVEENLRQQAELTRRNIEKRVVINRLLLQLKHLKNENRDLQNCISCLKVQEKCNQFQRSKSRGLFSPKFFGGGCS